MDMLAEMFQECITKKQMRLADMLFMPYSVQLSMDLFSRKDAQIASGDYAQRVQRAAETLADWEIKSGRTQNYTPEQLAEAMLAKEVAAEQIQAHKSQFTMVNMQHLGLCAVYMAQTGLCEKLIEEGRDNKKLALVEVSSRLAPIMTFPGSSAYLDAMIQPYAQNARTALGEPALHSYVSQEAASNSAKTYQEKFLSRYVLAETSAAPRKDVPRSARKPEVFISAISGYVEHQEHHTIDTPFRDHFDAKVRELMLVNLQRMVSHEKKS